MKLSNLFSPISIGKLQVKNRVVLPPMCTRIATHEGYVTKELVDYYGVLARGGAGLIIVEYAYIQPRGRAVFSQLAAHDNSCIEGLALLAEEIKLHDAVAVLQICHAGRQSTSDVLGGQLPLAPSAIPCDWISMLTGRTNYCQEMTQDEIEETIEAFSESVVRAQVAGYDAVEFHGAVGYLLMSFLSPYTNKRSDFYGGSLENRARFPLEVIRRSRRKVGHDFPLLYRFSADEFVDGGFTLEQASKFAKILETEGISALHVTGTTYDTIYKHELPMHLPGGNLIHLAENIKGHVSLPVIGVGSINDPIDADRYIGEGKADMIAMGRALLADPDLPRKAEEGRFDEIRPCIRCNEGCIKAFFVQSPHRCTVNFSCGRERHSCNIIRSSFSKKVTVIGGGPAGLEAARVASQRGHRVVLFESDEAIGGKLIIASKPAFKHDLLRYLEYLRKQTERLDLELRLNTRATPELVSETKPDVVVIATGARAISPEEVGISRADAYQVTDIFKDGFQIKGDSIVIVGGGYLGCEAALYLAQQGKKVTLLEKLEVVGKDAEILTMANFRELFSHYQIEAITSANVIEVSPGAAVYWKDGRSHKIKADSAVLALGFRPDLEDRKMFRHLAKTSYVVGDARSAGKLMQAIHTGFAAGLYL
jgi:2,4-dienoyl-CoA reductase-like NADH-dependent reductase (Old Yellow Enzyme family)/thioredoxin reductase